MRKALFENKKNNLNNIKKNNNKNNNKKKKHYQFGQEHDPARSYKLTKIKMSILII